jgi:hypothetical protein
MQSKMQPALLGGLLIGVLSALPFVSMCCCLWVIAGGVLTTYLLQERSRVPVTAGDAAVAGLLAGVIGAILSTILSQLLALVRGVTFADAINDVIGRARLPPEATGILEQVRDFPGALIVLFSLLMALIIYPMFALLGALLGVALFKRQPPPPPPGTMEILPPE